MSSKQRSVLASLIYSDLFSFPLVLTEVSYFSGEKLGAEECRRTLASLYPHVQEKQGYYFLQGRERTIRKREKGRAFAEEKYESALKAIRLLRKIPTVKYIGLSGTVATGSAKKSDDIDLFIITKKNTLFTTRFLLLLLLQVTGRRRRRNEVTAQDRCCLNMFMDEASLAFSTDRRDIYTAREIAQMIPLYEKDHVQKAFFKKNAWVTSLLPNVSSRPAVYQSTGRNSHLERVTEWLLSRVVVETCFKKWQLLSIQKHLTRETVSGVFLAFHTNDFHLKTVLKYRQRMKDFEAALRRKQRKTIRLSRVIDKEKNIFYTA